MSEELIEHIGNEHWEDALSMVQSDDSLLHTIDLEDLLWSKVSYHTNEFHKYSVENNLDKLQALENLIENCVAKGLKPKTVYSAAVLGDISLIDKMLQDDPQLTAYAIAKKLCDEDSNFNSFKVKVSRIVKRISNNGNNSNICF